MRNPARDFCHLCDIQPKEKLKERWALQAIAEVAKENLPMGFGYELGGMAREEAQTSGSTTGIIFVLCFVFVLLVKYLLRCFSEF